MCDDFDRDHVVKELKDIREKLLQLAAVQTQATNLKDDLSSIAERLEALIAFGGPLPVDQENNMSAKTILVVDDNEETREFLRSINKFR